MSDWKKSIPSSAGVFGVTGVCGVADAPVDDFELEADVERWPFFLPFGIMTEGLGFP